MIINEMAGSGGDLMPYMFKHRKIGCWLANARGAVWSIRLTRRPFVDGGR